MKKVKNLSLVAMLLAVVVAFAFKPAPKAAFTTEYAISSFDANYWYIQESLVGEELGVDYLCEEEEAKVCRITSNATPDLLNRIAIGAGTPIDEDERKYVDLTPDDGD